MPQRPQSQPPGKAKRRVLTAAAKLFRARGFARCTVRELAEEVGIQSGSLFHHFKSKDEILFAVMEEVIVQMDDALANALDSAQTPEAQIRALIRTELDFVHGPHANAAGVLINEWEALSPEGQARLLAQRHRYFDRWQEVLEQAHGLGVITISPTVLRQLIHGAIVWTAHWFKPDGPMSMDALTQSVVDLAIR